MLNLKFSGLDTHTDPFSTDPGALEIANNVVIDREEVVTTRRGFQKFGNVFDPKVADYKIEKLFEYQDRLIFHYTDRMYYDSDGSGLWSLYSGNFNKPDANTKIHSAEANKNLYITTAEGIEKLDVINGEWTDAGAPRALDLQGSLTGSSGFLLENTAVAYRILWGYRDENNNLILGYPSERFIVANPNGSGQSYNVQLTFTIPAVVTSEWFYQVYRSGPTLDATDEPNDELQLVYESNPLDGSPSEIAAKEVTFIENTPDSLRGAFLYTSPGQEGIQSGNNEPPFAKDIAQFKEYMFYANVRSKHTLEITLVGTASGSPLGESGLQVGDTITINGVTYTGAAVEDVSSNEFQVYSGGTTISTDIRDTAQSLVKVINKSSSNTYLNAYYASQFEELPGKIRLEERDLGGSTFYVTSSKPTAWSPEIPTSGTSIGSANNERPNRLMYSKLQEPEAVPLGNTLDVGSADKNILRILPTRDSLFVLKEDGFYRVTGGGGQWTVNEIDTTANILAPESAVVFNNQVVYFGEQGVVAGNDSGLAVISRKIESDILPLTRFSSFADVTFAVSYESDRKFILFVPTESGDTYATQAYVYNNFTNSWTKWTLTRSAGIVPRFDDRLFLASPDVGSNVLFPDRIYRERKDFTFTDYADDQFDVSIVQVNSNTEVVIAQGSPEVPVEAGMSIVQGVNVSYILEVNGGVLTLDTSRIWSVQDATIYTAIDAAVKPVDIDDEDPSVIKQWSELTLVFEEGSTGLINATFGTNVTGSTETVVLQLGTPTGGGSQWGGFPWGTVPWGSGGAGARGISAVRTFVPKLQQRALWFDLTIEQARAFSAFSLLGAKYSMKPISVKIRN